MISLNMGPDLEECYNLPTVMSLLRILVSSAILNINNCEYSVICYEYMCGAPKLHISI